MLCAKVVVSIAHCFVYVDLAWHTCPGYIFSYVELIFAM